MSVGVEQISDDEPELSVDEDESIEELVGRLALEVGEDSPDPEPTDAAPAAPVPETQTGPARDEHGRFAKKVSEPETAQGQAQKPPDGVTEAPKPETAEAPIPAPVSWAGEYKEAFARLPRDLQQNVAQRELQREALLLDTRRKWAAVEDLISPYEQAWAQRGISFPQVLNQMFAYSKGLNQDPIGTGLQMMAERGVTREQLLAALTQGQSGGQHGQPASNGMGHDPRFNQLLGEVQTLKQQLTAREQQEVQAFNEQTANQISAFFQNTKDDAGSLKYPFYVEAMPVMDAIAKQLRTLHPQMPMEQFLDLVYRKATAGDPRVEAHHQARQTQQSIADAGKRVEQARRMGSSLTGSPGGRMVRQIPDDDIEAQVRAIAYGEM